MIDNNYNSIFGYNIIGSSSMMDVVQVRIHKKKRINKKWRKRYGFKEVSWKRCYVFGDTIICHPEMIKKIEAVIGDIDRVR